MGRRPFAARPTQWSTQCGVHTMRTLQSRQTLLPNRMPLEEDRINGIAEQGGLSPDLLPVGTIESVTFY